MNEAVSTLSANDRLTVTELARRERVHVATIWRWLLSGDRGCYHCVRRVNLTGFLETVDRLAAPDARLLVLCGNANEQREGGPPRVTEAELRADWGGLFEIEWLREFRFEDRGGTPGPRGWSCWMTRRQSSRSVPETIAVQK